MDSIAYQRLKEIGTWIKINGEGIYGSRMNKTFGEGNNIRYTKSKDGKTQYAFLMEFPENKITLSKIDIPQGAKISMLGAKKNLKWKKTDAGYEITIPAELKGVSEHVWGLSIQPGIQPGTRD
jgi:alpha-L-fucosidase